MEIIGKLLVTTGLAAIVWAAVQWVLLKVDQWREEREDRQEWRERSMAHEMHMQAIIRESKKMRAKPGEPAFTIGHRKDWKLAPDGMFACPRCGDEVLYTGNPPPNTLCVDCQLERWIK